MVFTPSSVTSSSPAGPRRLKGQMVKVTGTGRPTEQPHLSDRHDHRCYFQSPVVP